MLKRDLKSLRRRTGRKRDIFFRTANVTGLATPAKGRHRRAGIRIIQIRKCGNLFLYAIFFSVAKVKFPYLSCKFLFQALELRRLRLSTRPPVRRVMVTQAHAHPLPGTRTRTAVPYRAAPPSSHHRRNVPVSTGNAFRVRS